MFNKSSMKFDITTLFPKVILNPPSSFIREKYRTRHKINPRIQKQYSSHMMIVNLSVCPLCFTNTNHLHPQNLIHKRFKCAKKYLQKHQNRITKPISHHADIHSVDPSHIKFILKHTANA